MIRNKSLRQSEFCQNICPWQQITNQVSKHTRSLSTNPTKPTSILKKYESVDHLHSKKKKQQNPQNTIKPKGFNLPKKTQINVNVQVSSSTQIKKQAHSQVEIAVIKKNPLYERLLSLIGETAESKIFITKVLQKKDDRNIACKYFSKRKNPEKSQEGTEVLSLNKSEYRIKNQTNRMKIQEEIQKSYFPPIIHKKSKGKIKNCGLKTSKRQLPHF